MWLGSAVAWGCCGPTSVQSRRHSPWGEQSLAAQLQVRGLTAIATHVSSNFVGVSGVGESLSMASSTQKAAPGYLVNFRAEVLLALTLCGISCLHVSFRNPVLHNKYLCTLMQGRELQIFEVGQLEGEQRMNEEGCAISLLRLGRSGGIDAFKRSRKILLVK